MIEIIGIVLHLVGLIGFFLLLIDSLLNKFLQKGYQKNISDVYTNAKFDVDDVTDLNFIQGKLGNCGMIASMASLVNNRELLEKVVPVNQNYNKKPLCLIFIKRANLSALF